MLHPVSTRVHLGILLLVSAAFFSPGSVAHADDERQLDPTCSEVNQAYLKSTSYPRYSVQMPLIREDGSIKPYMIHIVTEADQRTWRAFDKKWVTTRRVKRGIWDRYSPKFTNCTLVGDDLTSTGLARHYVALWSDFPYKASTDAWISKKDGLLRRVRRQYLNDRWKFSEATMEETFEYGIHEPAQLPK